MSTLFNRFFALLLCILLTLSLCSCKKSEPYYVGSEEQIISIERKPVDKNINEEHSMQSENISQNKESDTPSSKKPVQQNSFSSSKSNSNNSKTNNNASCSTTTGNKPQNTTSSSNTTTSSLSSLETKKEFKYEYEFFDSRYFNNSVLSKGNPQRIKNAFKKASAGKKITIAFIGGSITEGTGATAKTCFSGLVANWFEKTFGEDNINYVNAGIGTAGSLFGVHRVDADTLSHKPDIVFVDFAVNDKGKDVALEKATYDACIQKIYNSSSEPAIISVAMATEQKINSENNQSLICREYNIPMLSFSKYIHLQIASGKLVWSDIAIDNVHPNKAGHKIISELIIYYLEKVFADIDKPDDKLPTTITSPYATESSRYLSAERLNPTEIKTTSNEGFSSINKAFQYTNGYWESTTTNAEITFNVKTKTLTLFFGKLPSDGGRFEVYIDGELNGEYACQTGDTWEYINSKVVATFNTVQTHTITIKNISDTGRRILISGIGITS